MWMSFAVAAGLSAVAAGATRTENFDISPAHWQRVGTTDYGFSNTDNTGQESPAGEAGGRFRRLEQRDYYADTTIGVLTQNDAFFSTGELFVGNAATADNEAWIAHFSTETGSVNRNIVGLSIVEGRPDPSTGFRFTAHIYDSSGNEQRPEALNFPYKDESGNPILYKYYYAWDPDADRLTTRLLNPDGSLVQEIVLDAGPVQFTLNAFGLTGVITPGQDPGKFSDVFIDAATYTIASPAAAQWNVNASGNWSNPANWSGGVPNAPGAVANFGSVISAPRTVTLDAPMTVGVINFDNANSYTISGTSTLTIDAASGNGAINVLSGSHSIAAPIQLADNTTVAVAAGQTLSVRHMRGAGLT
ncbi:MAG TPA: hypothetical protein VNL70_05710, partial [Tepidisphaeraceae bacterium]|nr:hypothetical protein [Tepidisphaeraceae bacterium]